MAPCILTNATFHLVLPLCSQKDVWHRTSKKKKKYTFLCGILPKFALNHNTACWHHTIQLHEVANCVITELDNIIVEQQDPHTAHGQDLYDSVNHATSEPYNIKKSSFVTSLFFLELLKHLFRSIACPMVQML